MAFVRKDTLSPTIGWEKHLRPFKKRKQAAKERRAGKADAEIQWEEYEQQLKEDE